MADDALEQPMLSLADLRKMAASILHEFFDEFSCEWNGQPLPVPDIRIIDHLRSDSLADCLYKVMKLSPAHWKRITDGAGDNSVISIQRSILHDPQTVDRVLCHEVIHHVLYMAYSPDSPEFRSSHGVAFKRLCQKINAVRGVDYVTEKSDQTYNQVANTKPFSILILPNISGAKYGYQVAVRLSAKQQEKAFDAVRNKEAHLIQIVDRNFLGGASIGSGKWTVPQTPEKQALLKQMYETCRSVEGMLEEAARRILAIDQNVPPPQTQHEKPPQQTMMPASNPFKKEFLEAAKRAGVPESWASNPALLMLCFKESSFRPEAKNKASTAFGLFQLLKQTWEALMPGVEYGSLDPVQQAEAGMKYILKRYKTPERALAFWNATMARDAKQAPADLQGKAQQWVDRGYVGY